jgi:hypothetical protein
MGAWKTSLMTSLSSRSLSYSLTWLRPLVSKRLVYSRFLRSQRGRRYLEAACLNRPLHRGTLEYCFFP